MHIPQLAVSSLESPLLMRVQISNSHVVDNNIFYQCIPIDADLHVNLLVLRQCLNCLAFIWNIIFFHDIQAVQFFNRQ
jgi:hypothetical protein